MNENKEKKGKKVFGSRRLRYGSVATALSAGFLVVIILINVIASVVMEKYPLKIDLTKDDVYGITQESKDYIKDLGKDVTIMVLSTEKSFVALGTYFEQANEVLKDYAKNSDHVTLEYVDIVKDPTFSSNYPDLSLSVADVLVKSGDRIEQIEKADLFDVQSNDYGEQYIAASVAEQAITSAILNVTSDERPKVVFATGHGETDTTDFQTLIQKNNYEVVQRNLTTEDIDEDALFVVVAGPTSDFDDNSLAKIEAFLSNNEELGKNMLYFANPDQPATPNLEAFLEENGIQVGSGSVYETNNSRIYNNNPFFSIVDYVSNDYYKKLNRPSIYATFPRARPLSLMWENSGYMETAPLLNFGTTAVIRPADAEDDWTPDMAENDTTKQIPALVQASRLRYEGSEVIRSTIIVSGSTACLDASLLGSGSYSNAEYFISILNVLSNKDANISIVSKSLSGSSLGISTQQVIGISVVFVIVLPLVVMILGIAIWLIRRHK